jgi:hypothetical protein
MLKFYTLLWLFWALRMIFVSLLIGALLSILITSFLYLREGSPALSTQILSAVFDIFYFWFLLLLNLAIPIALLINTKYIFNSCINNISLKLISCAKEEQGEFISEVGFADILTVWRKMLFLIVWISAIFVLVSFLYFYLFSTADSFFEWLGVFYIYGFILLGGFFALILLTNRSKNVNLHSC